MKTPQVAPPWATGIVTNTGAALFTITPAPGVTPAQIEEHCRKARKVGMRRPTLPTDGPTARWVVPAGPSAVVCPTCDAPVNLPEWWSHGCGSVPLAGAGRLTLRVRSPKVDPETTQHHREMQRPVQTWNGDVPTSCNHCGSTTVRNGFADAPLSNGRTWGILCGMCWALTVRPTVGQYYERKGRRYVLTRRRG